MKEIQDFLLSVDLLAEVAKDAAVGGSFRGNFSRNTKCPFCGGTDRFNVRIGKDGIQRAYCRQCGGINPKTGKPLGWNAIDYVMKRDGIDFKAALAYWQADSRPALSDRPKHQAEPVTAPPQQWQDKARAFVDGCAKVLWSEAGAKALAYLRGRGLTDETIRRFKLGFNPEWRKRPGAEWGIDRDEVKAAPGITIPRFILGELWAVNVRRLGEFKGAKYVMVTGSVMALAGADDLKGASVALAFGGEFDMMLAAQHAPAGVACVTFGGEGKAIDELWRNMVSEAGKVLVCYDSDKQGSAGAFNWYESNKSVRRVKVPQGKDLTEYAQQGGNVAEWIEAQVAKAQGKPQQQPTEKPADTTQIQNAPQIEPEAQPAASTMAQDENDLLISRVIVGYLETEGALMLSKVAGQVLLATGWEMTDEVKAGIIRVVKSLVKAGRIVQLPTKALALAEVHHDSNDMAA